RPLLWTVHLSPHATCSSRAQDHARRPVRPSYHERVWPATSVRANRPPYSRGGPPRCEARCLRVRACRRDLVRYPIQCTKEPYQVVIWALCKQMSGQKGVEERPRNCTKE